MLRFSLIVYFFASVVMASPTPLTSSSRVISPLWGFYPSPQGYAIDARQTRWKIAIPEKGDEPAEITYRLPQSQALLTMKMDRDKKARNPKSYVASWSALYHRLGFDVLATRPFTLNGETAYVVDMIRKDKNRQARQAIFFRGDQAAILSCQDEIEPFVSSITECNRVIQTFRWIGAKPLTPTL